MKASEARKMRVDSIKNSDVFKAIVQDIKNNAGEGSVTYRFSNGWWIWKKAGEQQKAQLAESARDVFRSMGYRVEVIEVDNEPYAASDIVGVKISWK
jgi:hypothetical protein